ncbi:MAG TPA: hypothetical protein PL115_01055 [Bacteroidales bacterium]|jgi:hypothetical protein|nr:hypothetical protein [Bacteroidales bacterium]HPH53061.1 hypothetical protein [Bacteroidales bacterium]HPY21642.1 hypothetical protein [Bacteroidales bacterium]HQA93231.1 hypothetical protein [Bacteroidales bacterium]HQN23488.1 hypothetical protein [Bacteroidales bacterium]
MEEKRLKALGLREMTSIELQSAGGATVSAASLFDKVRAIINFIGDYLPKLLRGIIDGWNSLKGKK